MSKKYPNSKFILKIHLKPQNCVKISTYFDFVKTLLNESLNVNLLFYKSSNILLLFTYSVQHLKGNGEDVSKNILSGFSIKHASGNTIHDKGIGNKLDSNEIQNSNLHIRIILIDYLIFRGSMNLMK